jgi:nucleoside-diphosphate-sugar epimerase
MLVTIIGSDGYLASAVIKLLKEKQFEILCINRKNSPWLKGRSDKTILSAVMESDVVVNFAQVEMNSLNSFEQYKTNVLLHREIMEFLSSVNFGGKYLYLSSANVVTRRKRPFERALNHAKRIPSAEWQLQKLFSEMLVEYFGLKKNLNAMYLRVPNLFGLVKQASLKPGNSALNRIIRNAVLYKEVVLYNNLHLKRYFLHIDRVADFIEKNFFHSGALPLKNFGLTLLGTNRLSYLEAVKSLKSLKEFDYLNIRINSDYRLTDLELMQDSPPKGGVVFIPLTKNEILQDIISTAQLMLDSRP